MRFRIFPLILMSASCLTVFATALDAQTTVQLSNSVDVVAVPTAVQLFNAVDVQTSPSANTYSTPVTFNSTTLNLTCTAPITASLSGPVLNTETGALTPGGNLLVDNNILVTVTPASTGTPQGPVNVCPNIDSASGEGIYNQNCFTTAYQGPAAAGSLNGDDPDTYIANGTETEVEFGGVPPIDISSYLSAGSQSVNIALVDEGGWFTNSSVYLTTSCTQGGVTGPALVMGNPISSTPTPQQLTQTFNVDSGSNQKIAFVYDLSEANTANSLTVSGTPSPQVADLPLNPATFQSNLAFNTSFATSECLIHTGELGGPLGQQATLPACKLFTLECTTPANPVPSGAQCPISTVANEVVQDIFDGPNFSLEDIHTRDGRIFHEGIGFLMASEGWGSESGVPPGTWNWNGGAGGPCTFDPAADLNLPCPQNMLSSFTGPGLFSRSGETTHPNSTFISIAKVPEDRTEVRIDGEWPGHWINRQTVHVRFRSQPPDLRHTGLPGAENFIPSPIQSITYGVSPADSVPVPANEPIPGDTTLLNSACPIPTAADPGPPFAPDFTPAEQTLTFAADGRYLLHFYACDCAGTQEFKFAQVSGSWTTDFYTREINVDTVPPAITGLVLTPSPSAHGTYTVGEQVKASYSCSDATSGVVLCGDKFYAPGSTFNTGTLTTTVDTRWPGTKTFTVWAADAAGNRSSASVTYKVVGPAGW